MGKRRRQADPSKAIGYIRVSTDDQALSVAAQTEAMARWCEREGVQLVAVCDDLGVSGAAPMHKRPGLIRALADLDVHGAGVLLVAKRDRLARDVMTSAMVEASAQRIGARVVSTAGEGTEGEVEDPTGLLMRRLVDAFSEYERALIASRTRAALAVKRQRGELTGTAPIGSTVADDGQTLTPDGREARAVTLILDLRGEGLSIRDIAERLNREGVDARGARWHATTVARVLKRAA